MVGGAWPLLVALTPAAERPWISGTSDNSILSLIFGYNGVGRLSGQSGGPGGGGPGGGGGALFGGPTGPFRLLQSALGDQAGWLLGFAVVAGLALLIVSRLRRNDPRTGWLLVVGGAFVSCAVAFSFAQGIFHPYYVSLLAPFTAALVGAGAGLAYSRTSSRTVRWLTPAALAAGALTELIVLSELNGALSWTTPLVIAGVGGSVAWLLLAPGRRLRAALLTIGLGALMIAPAAWAAETLGHAESSTFPVGGAASTARMGPGPGAGGPPGGSLASGGPGGGALASGGPPPGVFGAARGGGFGGPSGAGVGFGPPPGAAAIGGPPRAGAGSTPRGGGAGLGAPIGVGTSTLRALGRYVAAHGGGTIGVSSQGSAAAAILATHADFAGLGGFSGRESSVSTSWLAAEVKAGRLRWIVADNGGDFRAPQDTRQGSRAAISAAEKACRRVVIKTASGSASSSSSTTIYDCLGRANAIAAIKA